MLNDENRTGFALADGNSPFGANIVGSGAGFLAPIPEPMTSALTATGLALIGLRAWRRRGQRVGRAAS